MLRHELCSFGRRSSGNGGSGAGLVLTWTQPRSDCDAHLQRMGCTYACYAVSERVKLFGGGAGAAWVKVELTRSNVGCHNLHSDSPKPAGCPGRRGIRGCCNEGKI